MDPSSKTSVYFVFGHQAKHSLVAQFCREHGYARISNPIPETIGQPMDKNTFIESKVEFFHSVKHLLPQLVTVFVGKQLTADEEAIRRDYNKIGKAIMIHSINYNDFRKALYPRLIFLYGPELKQISDAISVLSAITGYRSIDLPDNANILIKTIGKTRNYLVNGLFTSEQQLTILEEYFDIRVVHLQYNRIDLPDKIVFFNQQSMLLPFLKTKPYYVRVNGKLSQEALLKSITAGLCPELVYAKLSSQESLTAFEAFVESSKGLLITTQDIKAISQIKKVSPNDQMQEQKQLTKVIYKSFQPVIYIADYPQTVQSILEFEAVTRPFKHCIDLTPSANYKYSSNYTPEMYFLEHQKRIVVDLANPLQTQLKETIEYWIVSGPSCIGKSTVARYIAAQQGMKVIEFQPYLASIKQKLMTPEDGEELPIKKVVAYFKNLFTSEKVTFILDGFPYDNKDLALWLTEVGSPSVVNLKVEFNELVKRTRRKNQADLNAEVGEEQKAKITQVIAKSSEWFSRVHEFCPSAKIYNLDFNSPIIIAEKLVNTLFKSRVYLVQSNDQLCFNNIALKHNMGFLNLKQVKLHNSRALVQLMKTRDIVLCHYSQPECSMISEDLYWIEKNIGEIRYVAIWNHEAKLIPFENIILERPVVEQKQKVEGEGEDKQEQPPAEDAKKQFDVYAYQWTKPSGKNNLSQQFLLSKSNIVEMKTDRKHLYQSFGAVMQHIQAGKCVFEEVQ